MYEIEQLIVPDGRQLADDAGAPCDTLIKFQNDAPITLVSMDYTYTASEGGHTVSGTVAGEAVCPWPKDDPQPEDLTLAQVSIPSPCAALGEQMGHTGIGRMQMTLTVDGKTVSGVRMFLLNDVPVMAEPAADAENVDAANIHIDCLLHGYDLAPIVAEPDQVS